MNTSPQFNPENGSLASRSHTQQILVGLVFTVECIVYS